ncbi:MAG: CopL family metal-binding regulatory protein [Xanthomonadales bacterium]|nr:CopL family metal-binding regulatory protein [Xanthomonadales bacterium]
MTVWSLLIRVILSLSLALNGAATAAVSVSMSMPGMPAASGPTQLESADQGSDDMPCHGHQSTKASSVQIADAISNVDQKPAPDGQPTPDCCKSGLCQCACMYAAQAVLTVAMSTRMMNPQGVSLQTLNLGHASPELPHLIRPPIG